jgi:hypothetical protein
VFAETVGADEMEVELRRMIGAICWHLYLRRYLQRGYGVLGWNSVYPWCQEVRGREQLERQLAEFTAPETALLSST